MAKIATLTTIDNPFDPIDQFSDWLSFDTEKGYDCCGIVARLAKISNELSDEENFEELNKAITDFVAADPLRFYKKVVR